MHTLINVVDQALLGCHPNCGSIVVGPVPQASMLGLA